VTALAADVDRHSASSLFDRWIGVPRLTDVLLIELSGADGLEKGIGGKGCGGFQDHADIVVLVPVCGYQSDRVRSGDHPGGAVGEVVDFQAVEGVLIVPVGGCRRLGGGAVDEG